MFSKAATILLVGAIFQAMYVYASTEGPKKVTATLYYESLCPYCHDFIEKQLIPTFHIMSDYLKVELVPYGNAERNFVDGHWQFTCQHGKPECEQNIVDACAVAMLQDRETAKLLNFVTCVSKRKGSLYNRAAQCLKVVNIPYFDKYRSCLKSPNVDQLMLIMAKKTESVRPTIIGVPTVQIDGVYDPKEQDEIQDHFKKVVCKHLGDQKPDICNEV